MGKNTKNSKKTEDVETVVEERVIAEVEGEEEVDGTSDTPPMENNGVSEESEKVEEVTLAETDKEDEPVAPIAASNESVEVEESMYGTLTFKEVDLKKEEEEFVEDKTRTSMMIKYRASQTAHNEDKKGLNAFNAQGGVIMKSVMGKREGEVLSAADVSK